MIRLLPLLLLLVAGPALAQGSLFATTTTYEIFGGTAQIAVTPPYSSVLDAYEIHSDAVVRGYGKRWAFILNRLGGDNVLVLDRQTNFGVVTQYSVSGTGLNPRDIHVEPVSTPGSNPGRAFITLYESNSLMVCDALTGANVSTIDLSVFADGDGLCEMDQMVEVNGLPGHPEGLLFVCIQRQDRSGSWWVAGDATIALVDVATESLVDANPATPEIDGIDLQSRNPFWRISLLEIAAGWRVLVDCPGDYGVLDGGIEIVNPYSLQSEGMLVTEAQLGGDILDFQLVGKTLGWAIRSDATFVTSLVQFDIGTGSVVQTAHTSSGFDLVDLEMSFDGRMFVGDRDASTPGVRIYNPGNGALLAGPLDTGLPPFDLELFDDIPVSAPPKLTAATLTAAPNPFNPRVEIRLEPARANQALEVLDLRGRRVARIDGVFDGNAVRWSWDGTDLRGDAVASGAYLARPVGGEATPVKLTLVR